MTTKSLYDIWVELDKRGMGTDKFSVHSYGDVYEELFEPYRNKLMNFLEIGIFRGDSLRLWEAYFKNANVHGIDCDEQPHGGMADLRPMMAEGTHNIHILDGTNEEQIQKEFGDRKWSIVIDDGAHNISAQLKTIEIFSKRMAEGGLLIVEDLQDFDNDKKILEQLPYNITLVDLRHKKGRYDDTMAILKF